MNRYIRCLSGASAALFIAATQALCANVLLDDNFSNADNWTKSAATPNTVTAAASGGSFTVDNLTGASIGEYVHDFGANKPAAFTLSYVLKSVQGGTAGALFCRQPGNYPSGYLLTLDANNGLVVVYKVISTVTATGWGVKTVPIFHKNSLDLNLTPGEANKFTVSKNGSQFQISVNDEFQGNATDTVTSAPVYSTGDISLLLFNQTKAVFGNLRVTDEFTPGANKTEFSDNFDDGVINKYWRQDITSQSGPAPVISETGGKLRMTSKSAAYIYIDINLTDFNAKAEASHISGKPDVPYGVFLLNENWQMIKFLIMGGGYYYALKPGTGSYSPIADNIIKGSGQTDILEIKKSEDSPNYEFIVNGKSLNIDFLGQTNFNVKGIGLFCEDTISVAFDNFNVKQNKSVTSVSQNNNKQISRAKPPLTAGGRAFYDMRGRKRYSVATPTAGRVQTRAAGIYVNKNGRDVAVKKGKVTGE